MKFSIIIPVYNRERYISNAIESVIDMEYSDWELIVVDDCSSDNTNAVCSYYSEKDDRIVVLRHETNKGVSAARNTAILKCSGDYIIFLDSDDTLDRVILSELNKKIEEHKDIDIIAFGYKNGGGSEIWSPDRELVNKGLIDLEFIRKYILPEHINILPQRYFLKPFVCNKCYKRNMIIDNLILFDESRRTWEDNAFFVNCLDKSNNIVCMDKVFYVIGYNDSCDHLSRICNEELLFNYIKSYEENIGKYSKEYDFDNPYTNYRYFNVTIYDICYRLVKKYDKAKCKKILKSYCECETVQNWVRNVKPKNMEEKELCMAIINKRINFLYRLIGSHDKRQVFYGRLSRIKNILKVV